MKVNWKSGALLLAGFLFLGTVSSKAEKSAGDTLRPCVFHFDGGVKEASGKCGPVELKGTKFVADRNDKPGMALGLMYNLQKKKKSRAVVPVNINPDQMPFVTLVFWIRIGNNSQPSYILSLYDHQYRQEEAFRGLYIAREDDYYRWMACSGKDGSLEGPEVLSNRWTFIAMLYDRDNQAIRMVVDDQVFSGPAAMRSGDSKITIGPFDGAIDELTIFRRLLTLEELEDLYGSRITRDTGDFPIAARGNYKERLEHEKTERVKANTTWVVAVEKFPVYDSDSGHNVAAIVAAGDTFRVVEVIGEEARLLLPDGKTGFAGTSRITRDAYLQGDTWIGHWMGNSLRYIFDFTRLRSWIIAVVFGILLFIVIRKYDHIDRLLNRIRRHDPHAGGGGKSEGGSGQNPLKKVFPLKKFRWWPLTIGAVIALGMIIALIWDSRETEWFFNEGFSMFAKDYSRPIHWFLFGTVILVGVMFLTMILESVVIAGPFLALPRILLLSILIFMTLIVVFYLSVIVIVVTIAMVILKGLSSGSSNYRCPHCGRTFSASAGSSGSCPYCGGGVST